MSEQNEPVVGVDKDGTIKLDLRPNAVREPIAEEAPVQEAVEVVEEVPVQKRLKKPFQKKLQCKKTHYRRLQMKK
jgi:hypothetical protein